MLTNSRLARFAPSLFAAAALMLAAGAASADDPILDNAVVADGVTVPTDAECQSAWDNSGAANTCGAGGGFAYIRLASGRDGRDALQLVAPVRR